jgi:hypothetical protein
VPCAGKNRFALDGDVADESPIRCYFCSHEIGTMAELKARVAKEVLKRKG